MPVSFLTPEIEASYGRYHRMLTPAELAGAFHFDDTDRRVLSARKGNRAKLGFALQLGTVRFLGRFCDLSDVPEEVVDYVARQLAVDHPHATLSGYDASQTRWAHTREIRSRFGYRDLHDPTCAFRFDSDRHVDLASVEAVASQLGLPPWRARSRLAE